MEGSDQREGEMERFLPPGIVFVVFPTLLSFFGVLVLTELPWLIGQYNYLRGASSPIDQSTLALLGSDLSRLVVLISSIIGMMIGLYLSRFVTTKIDVVRKEGAAELSTRMYFALLLHSVFPMLLQSTIYFSERIVYGYPTSRFLSDLGFFMLAGYFLAFSIPVLLRYVLLVLHTRTIDSQVILIGLRSGSGFKKRFQYLTLRVISEGPDP